MSLDAFEIKDIFEEYFNVEKKSKRKNEQKQRKRDLVRCFFRQRFIKPTQVLFIGCRHRSNNSKVFSIGQGGLYNIPNVYIESTVYLEQGFIKEYDTPSDDCGHEESGKNISATGELLDFLHSNPTTWKRINYPGGVISLS